MKKLLGLPIKTGLIFLIVFSIAFTIYCFAWPKVPILDGDSSSYIDLSVKLKNGIINSPQFRLIGYPLFLIITGSSPKPTRNIFYVSIILHFVSIWLLSYIIFNMNINNKLKIIYIFCAVLLLPMYVESSGIISTENLAEFTLAIVFFCLCCWYRNGRQIFILIGGIFCAVSLLVRPTYILLWLALCPVLLISKKILPAERYKLKGNKHLITAIFLLIFPSLLTIGGYYVYNYSKFGYLGITPRVGFQLFTKNLKYLEDIPDQYAKLREMLISERDKSLIERGSSHTGVQFVFGKAGSINKIFAKATGKSPEELDREMLKLNLKLIAKRPLEYLYSVATSLVSIWFPSMTKLSFGNLRSVQLLLSLIHFVMVGIFFLYVAFFIVREIIAAIIKYNLTYSYLSCSRLSMHPYDHMVAITGIMVIIYTIIISATVDVGAARHLKPVLMLIWLLNLSFIGQWHKVPNASTTC